MKQIKMIVVGLAMISASAASSVASAQTGPSAFSYEGRLYDSATNLPSTHTVNLKLQVLHPTPVSAGVYCIVREEEVTGVDLSASSGYFSVAVGVTGQLTGTDPGNSMATVFANSGTITGFRTDNGSGCTPSSTGGLSRLLRVVVTDVTAGNTVATLAPDVGIGTTPYALAADSLQGFTPNDLLILDATASTSLNQAALGNIFSNANYAKLQALLAGTSTMYSPTSSSSGSKVPTVAGTVSSPVAGSMWVDTNTNQLMYHNGVGVVAVSGSGGSGTVTSVVAGAGLSGGTITTSGTISLPVLGAGGTAIKVTYDIFGRITAASSLTSIDIPLLDASIISTGTLSSAILPIMPVSKGGTNSPTALNNNRLLVSSGGAIIEAPALTNGQIFIGQTGGAPFPATLTAGSGISIANSAGGITISSTGGVTSLQGLAGGTVSSGIELPAGTAASPSMALGASNNGFYYASGSPNRVGVTVGGVSAVNFTSNGMLGIGTTNPASQLDVQGALTISAVTGNRYTFMPPGGASIHNYYLPIAAPSAGQVLTAVSSGSLAWTTVSAGSGSSGLTGLTGDIVASGTGSVTATIQPGVITFAKMQNINGQRLLGNSGGSLASTQEIWIGSGLSLTGGVLSAISGSTGSSGMTSLYGDVVAAGTGSAAATIAANAVTFSKFQNVNGLKLIGNPIGSVGAVNEISVGTGLTLLGGTLAATGGGTGSSTLTLSGDLSGSGAGTLSAVIQNGAVSFSKMQNINGQRLLGNSSGTLSQTQEIAVGSGLSFTGGILSATGGGSITSINGLSGGSLASSLDVPGSLAVSNSPSSRYVFQVPAGSGVQTWTLPSSVGASGYVLSTNGAGSLAWVAASGAGDFLRNGSASMTGQFLSVAGSSLAPGLTFGGDSDTGIYHPAANQLGFSTGGVQRLFIGATGNVGIGTNIPANALDVNGSMTSAGDIAANSTVKAFMSSPAVYVPTSTSLELPQAGHFLGENTSVTDGSMSLVQLTASNTSAFSQSAYIGAVSNSGATNTPTIVVGVQTGTTAYAERLRINAAGKVGIGTTAPVTGVGLDVRNGAIAAGSQSSTLGGEVRLYQPGANYVAFRAPNTVAFSQTWTLPSADGAPGQVLATDGGGTLSWVAAGTIAGGTMSGSVTGSALLSGQIWVGSASNTAQPVSPSGDVTINNAGQFIVQGKSVGNAPNTLVTRDGSGGFAAGSITASDVIAGAFIVDNGSASKVKLKPSAVGTLAYALDLPSTPGAAGSFLTATAPGTLGWAAAATIGDFKSDGSVMMSGALRAIAGSSLSPGVSFTTDTSTGLYSPALGMLAINAATVTVAKFTSSIGASSYFLLQAGNPSTGPTLSGSGGTLTLGGKVIQSAISGSGGSLSIEASASGGSINIGGSGFATNVNIGVAASGLGSLSVAGPIRVLSTTGSAYGFKAPATGPGMIYTMPQMNPTSSPSVLTSDMSGVLSWSSALQLGSGSAALPAFSFTTATNTGMFAIGTNTLGLSTGGTERIRIDASGNVGIGINAPTYQLQLSTDSAAKPGTSTWTIASDVRLKDVTGDFSRGLVALDGLRPIYFNYKKDNPLELPSETTYVGIRAQDAEASVPEAVSHDDKGYLHVTNDAILWTMVNSIKELYHKWMDDSADVHRELASVKDRAAKLETENKQLKAYLCSKDGSAPFCGTNP